MTQQQPMTNEQFALRIATEKYSNPSDSIRIADRYYEWLETKRKKPGLPIPNTTIPQPDYDKKPTLYNIS
jgi:hypothetical protein